MEESHNALLRLFSERKTNIFLVIFLVFLNSLVFILPYCVKGYTIPVGWDTPWYIRNMRLIKEQGIHSFFVKTREINLFCILEYLFASAFNISFMLTETILPIIIALLFPLVNFQIIRKFTGSWKLSLVAMAFTIVDYNTVRMTVDLHRNLFCLLLSEVAVFLILPRILEKASKKDFFLFVLLVTVAGLSQLETLAIVMFTLIILSIAYFKKHFLSISKPLWLCILIPTLLVASIEAPFLSIFIKGHMTFNPAVNPYRQDFVAQPWCYLVSLGSGLIPLYVIGMYFLLKELSKNFASHEYLLICLWNFVVIACSFLPLLCVRLPGWRVLLLTTVPPVATLGFAKLFSNKSLITKKKLVALTVLITISVTTIIVNQNRSYRPWISEENYRRLVWIDNENQNSSCVIVLCLDNSPGWVELYRNWIWAVVGTRTNVYFGDVDLLLQGKPTNFEDPYLNMTSHIFWNQLEDFTLEGANIYLIEEWYEGCYDNEKLVEVESGIFRVKH